MVILGIADSFTSGAAIVIDGRVISAVSEERLDRNKMSMGFPNLSVAEVMKIAGIGPADIDMVAVATSNLFWRSTAEPMHDYFRNPKGRFRDAFLALGSTFSPLVGDLKPARQVYYGLKAQLTQLRRRQLPQRLRRNFDITAPVTFLDHHLCHAASAYFTSGFREATVITQDGAGDGKCSRVFKVVDGRFKLLQKLDSYDSVGNYYSYVTHLCGFNAHKHEGKITGLAAYGQPAYLDILRRFVSHDGKTVQNTGRCFDHSAIDKLNAALPKDFSREDLSASVQVLLEESIASYCDYWVEKSGIPDVALAGGVFANVKLNQRVHELDRVRNLFVHPGMGDEGLGVGAALFMHNTKAGYKAFPAIDDVYLGAEQSPAEIQAAIRKFGFRVPEASGGIEKSIAGLLADGKVVARCAGRMEYGPRALGNRTIMYQATDPSVNQWLNDQLSRTEFMPFAPVTLWEDRHSCYRSVEGAEDTARFMTITFDCTGPMRRKSPAVCHVDGTARPQLIRERDNPSYYKILAEYKELTGIPTVINTSFNMHEEPIVNTAEEALKAFAESRLDALVLGDSLILADPLGASKRERVSRFNPHANESINRSAPRGIRN